MGFGILLFGYLVTFAFSLSNVYFFADIIGAAVMIYGMIKLSQYNRYFIASSISALIFSAGCLAAAASLMFGLWDSGSSIGVAVSIVKLISACVMHIFIFLGIRGLSKGAGSLKLVRSADRSMVMTMIYYLAGVFAIVFGGMIGDISVQLNMAVYIYFVVCLIVNFVLFYKCFGILCPADEDEDAPKKSRFAIINKLNDKFDSFEKKTQEYTKDSMKMAIDEAGRRTAEKSKGKKKWKKKK